MSKVYIEKKNGKTFITNKLAYPEAVNERVYTYVRAGMYEGVLPITAETKRKETVLECSVQGLIPLTHYFGSVVTKEMFLDIVYKLVVIIKNLEKNMLNANNLDLYSDLVFIDPHTKNVKCVYWPVVNNQRDRNPYTFLKQLPLNLSFHTDDGADYIETYKAFFGGITPFSINGFERMILKLQGKEGLSGIATPMDEYNSLKPGSNHQMDFADNKKSESIEYDPFSSVEPEKAAKATVADDTSSCPSCGCFNKKSSRFCFNCGLALSVEKPADAEEPITENNAIDANEAVNARPFFIRLKTKEKFEITKPCIRIGTDEARCDYYIADNRFISRSHADIIDKDGKYYIVDRNSTNKTYVNGAMAPVAKEIEISSGTEIRLANEDFVFSLEK